MKPLHLAAITAVSIFALSACSGSQDPATPSADTEGAVEAAAFAAVTDARLDNAEATPCNFQCIHMITFTKF